MAYYVNWSCNVLWCQSLFEEFLSCFLKTLFVRRCGINVLLKLELWCLVMYESFLWYSCSYAMSPTNRILTLHSIPFCLCYTVWLSMQIEDVVISSAPHTIWSCELKMWCWLYILFLGSLVFSLYIVSWFFGIYIVSCVMVLTSRWHGLVYIVLFCTSGVICISLRCGLIVLENCLRHDTRAQRFYWYAHIYCVVYRWWIRYWSHTMINLNIFLKFLFNTQIFCTIYTSYVNWWRDFNCALSLLPWLIG